MGSLGIAKAIRGSPIDSLAKSLADERKRKEEEAKAARFNMIIGKFLNPEKVQKQVYTPPVRTPKGPLDVGPDQTDPLTGEKFFSETPGRTETKEEQAEFDPTNPAFIIEMGKAAKKKPEEITEQLIQTSLQKKKAVKPTKKSIDRVVGIDGFYYDVLEDPETGKTTWEKSNVLAPEKEWAKTEKKGKRTVSQVVGKNGFYYDVVEDQDTGKTEWRKSNVQAPEKAGKEGKEEEDSYYATFTKQDGTTESKVYKGTRKQVKNSVTQRLAAIDSLLSKHPKSKDNWSKFKSGEMSFEDIQNDDTAQAYAYEYTELKSLLDGLGAGEPKPITPTTDQGKVKKNLPPVNPGETKEAYIKRLKQSGYEITP